MQFERSTDPSLDVLRIRLLGGFLVTLGSRPIEHATWRRRKARGLIKLLALAPGRRLHREQLLDALCRLRR